MNMLDLGINSRGHEPTLLPHPANKVDLGLTLERLDDRRSTNDFSAYHIHAHCHPIRGHPP